MRRTTSVLLQVSVNEQSRVRSDPVLKRIVDGAGQPRSTVLTGRSRSMDPADIDPTVACNPASAVPAGGIDGIAKPVRTTGRYRPGMRPHRTQRFVTRITGDGMRTSRIHAPAGVTAMRSRAQHDQRVIVVAVRAVVPCRRGDGPRPCGRPPRLIATVLRRGEIQAGIKGTRSVGYTVPRGEDM